MKIGRMPTYKNSAQNLSFASKVVYESSRPNQPLSEEIKDYIDNFEEANSKPGATSKKSKLLGLIFAGVGIAALSTIAIIKHKNTKRAIKGMDGKIDKSIKKGKIFDMDFKQNIINALKKENIICKAEDLDSVVGPEEFSELITKFSPEDFKISKETDLLDKFTSQEEFAKFLKENPDKLQEYYANFTDGKFRVSLHSHSNFSDGRGDIKDILEYARRYADYVAQKNSDKTIPPFTFALTDHDSVDGAREIIKLIAQDPKKYKNLKFISGAEIGVRPDINVYGQKHFDVTALGINPFDETISNLFTKTKEGRMNAIKSYIAKYNDLHSTNYTFNDLIQFEIEKSGKQDIKTMSGHGSVRHAIKFFEKMTGEDIPECYREELLLDGNMIELDEAISTIHGVKGKVALTHPLKTFWRSFTEDTLDGIKAKGIDGIEANHQYSPNDYYKLKEHNLKHSKTSTITESAKEIYDSLSDYASKNNMFLCGGTDSHNNHPFIYHPNDNFIREFIDKTLANIK